MKQSDADTVLDVLEQIKEFGGFGMTIPAEILAAIGQLGDVKAYQNQQERDLAKRIEKAADPKPGQQTSIDVVVSAIKVWLSRQTKLASYSVDLFSAAWRELRKLREDNKAFREQVDELQTSKRYLVEENKKLKKENDELDKRLQDVRYRLNKLLQQRSNSKATKKRRK